jgi:hypothetical protein
VSMLVLAEHDRQEWRIASGAADSRASRMRSSVAISLALHAAAILALAVLGLPGAETGAAGRATRAGQSGSARRHDPGRVGGASCPAAAREGRRDEDRAPKPRRFPRRKRRPPPSASVKAPDASPPPVVAAAKPQTAHAVAKLAMIAHEDRRAAAPQRAPADALATRLEKLAQLRQPPAQLPPSPRQQEGSGASNVNAASANATRGRDASYGVKDYIRSQVERRWNRDRRPPQGGFDPHCHRRERSRRARRGSALR